MREIKFRQWDRAQRKMIYNFQMLSNIINIKSNEYILMQYIGKNDSRGVSIYEGDIVLFLPDDNYGDKTIGLIKYSYKPYLGFIAASKCSSYYLNPFFIKKTEMLVVGNVYENPKKVIREYRDYHRIKNKGK